MSKRLTYNDLNHDEKRKFSSLIKRVNSANWYGKAVIKRISQQTFWGILLTASTSGIADIFRFGSIALCLNKHKDYLIQIYDYLEELRKKYSCDSVDSFSFPFEKGYGWVYYHNDPRQLSVNDLWKEINETIEVSRMLAQFE